VNIKTANEPKRPINFRYIQNGPRKIQNGPSTCPKRPMVRSKTASGLQWSTNHVTLCIITLGLGL